MRGLSARRLLTLGMAWAIATGCVVAAPKAGAGAKKSARLKTIFDYKQDLKLTDDQETKIKQALRDLQTQLRQNQESLARESKAVKDLIDRDEASATIRAALERMAKIEVDMRMADIATSKAINQILTPAQMRRWREIQSKVRAGETRQKTDAKTDLKADPKADAEE